MSECCNSLSLWRFGLAIGITWSLGLLFLGFLVMYCDWGSEMVNMLGSVYVGYEATYTGIFIGAAWGLVDGFIAGFFIALIYNLLGKLK